MITYLVEEQLPAPVPAHKARDFEMGDWSIVDHRTDDPSPVFLIYATALLVGIPNLIVGFLIGVAVTL